MLYERLFQARLRAGLFGAVSLAHPISDEAPIASTCGAEPFMAAAAA